MLKRLLTLFLLLSFLVPTSLFASTLHRCPQMDGQLMDAADGMPCCSQAAPQSSAGDGVVHLSHRCDLSPTAVEHQPATATFKTQLESPYPAGLVPTIIASRSPSDCPSPFPAGVLHFLPPGNALPVFLRNCSFLI
jgi:hypothetical protein